jgi:hypothetical protein
MPCGVWKTTDIPADRVDAVVAGYQLDGPVSVTKAKQADGKWTVTATFPPCAPPKPATSQAFAE